MVYIRRKGIRLINGVVDSFMIDSGEKNKGLKKCECGQCDEMIPTVNKLGKPSRFKHGHNTKGGNHPFLGKKLSETHIKNLVESHIGKGRAEHNGMWKGEAVGYGKLHDWVKKYYPPPIPLLCVICKEKKPLDLANVTGIYTRDFENWKFMCRRCHLYFDNIIERNLIEKGKTYRFKKRE